MYLYFIKLLINTVLINLLFIFYVYVKKKIVLKWNNFILIKVLIIMLV